MSIRQVKAKSFWNWFQQNEEYLFNFEDNPYKTFAELNQELYKINKHLTFEFGPKEGNKREIIISADGIVKSFPSVTLLKDTAPNDLTHFEIKYFRPRRKPLGILTLGDITLNPEEIFFLLRPEKAKIGIDIFIRDYSTDHEEFYWMAVFLFLDQAIGEYEVATKVGTIDIKQYSQTSSNLSLMVLAEYFDNMSKAKTAEHPAE